MLWFYLSDPRGILPKKKFDNTSAMNTRKKKNYAVKKYAGT